VELVTNGIPPTRTVFDLISAENVNGAKMNTILHSIGSSDHLDRRADRKCWFFPQGGAVHLCSQHYMGKPSDQWKGIVTFDTVLSAATFKGVDVITLGLSIPLPCLHSFCSPNSLRGGCC